MGSTEKRQLILTKREECPIMGGNMWLIKHLFEYMNLRDQLAVMSVNYSSYKLLREDNRYWYRLWCGKKYQKPSGYKVYHRGPVKYGCMEPTILGYYLDEQSPERRAVTTKITNVNLKDVNITDGDIQIINQRHADVIKGDRPHKATTNNTGYMFCYYTCTGYKNRLNGTLDKLAKDHWAVKEVYPLNYYGNNYDSNKDYYVEIMQQYNLSQIEIKVKKSEALLTANTWRLQRAKNDFDYYKKNENKIKKKLGKWKLALEISKKYQPIPDPISNPK